MTQSPTTTAAATSTPARANLVGLHVLTGGQPPEETPFVLKTFLAGGAFGQVYSALDEKTGTEVAVKLERYDAKYRQLYLEFGFYQRLGRECPYAPEILFFGQVANAWTALVMEMLGPSLKRVQELLGGALSVQCTTAVAIRLLRHLADFHRHGLIFRDVKPDNFLLGPPASGRAHSLYLIDLGLAKNWRSEADGSHIPFTEGKPLTGTLAYVSLNMHRGFELSRRDDLECLLYMLIHLGTGSLPWFAGDRQVGKDFARKMAYYGDSKRDTPIDEIIGGLPPEYGTLLRKVRALGFEETPEYELYGRLLGKVLTSRGFSGLTAQDRGSAGERSFSRAFDWGPALQIRRSRSKGSSSSSSTSTGGKHTEEGGANNSGGSSKERPSMQSKRKSRQRTSSAKRK